MKTFILEINFSKASILPLFKISGKSDNMRGGGGENILALCIVYMFILLYIHACVNKCCEVSMFAVLGQSCNVL